MKNNTALNSAGFTLIEVLIVIAIIATLVATVISSVPRMMQTAKSTKEMQNLHQIGPLIATYASDHNMKLPPANGPFTGPDGTNVNLQWSEICLAMLYPDTRLAEFRTAEWWDNNRPILRNSRFREDAAPRGRSPLNPGYALNEMIAENLALVSTGFAPPHEELLTISVPIAALSDPSRTPLIAPCDNYYFRYDESQLNGFKNGTLKELLHEGKFPLLFVDGHIEVLSPKEYLDRKLFLVPIVHVP